MSMNTIALEFVPPNVDGGEEKAVEEAQKVIQFSRQFGMEGRIQHLMIPGMIEEEGDRPVEMKPKMDPLDVWKTVRPEFEGMRGLCTQVTAFMDENQLGERFDNLMNAGMDGAIFVGVPRTMADGEGNGVPPTDALDIFRDKVPNRGVILIPTREGEQGRFNFKCNQGATFGMTQLLYSDAIVDFLKQFARETEHRPEILLSFGHVPSVETRLGLVQWLIQDPGNPAVEKEQAFVRELAEMEFKDKKQAMLDLYKSVIDQVLDLGFPISLHFEAPCGFVEPAFETFAAMLDYWAPDR